MEKTEASQPARQQAGDWLAFSLSLHSFASIITIIFVYNHGGSEWLTPQYDSLQPRWRPLVHHYALMYGVLGLQKQNIVVLGLPCPGSFTQQTKPISRNHRLGEHKQVPVSEKPDRQTVLAECERAVTFLTFTTQRDLTRHNWSQSQQP